MRMKRIIYYITKFFQIILYLFTLPAMLIYKFFNWIMGFEPGGLFAIGTLIWCIYKGWQDVHIDGAGLLWTGFKYSMIFAIFAGIFCLAIDSTCYFLSELFAPGAKVNAKMKSEILKKKHSMDSLESESKMRFKNGSFVQGDKREYSEMTNEEIVKEAVRQAQMEKEKAEKQREYEAKCRAYEEYKRIMREEQARKEREQREREQQQRASATNQEYQSALSMFMLEEGYTLEQLKKQRNRLLKSFHPDEGNGEDNIFAQKINVAFDLLKSKII